MEKAGQRNSKKDNCSVWRHITKDMNSTVSQCTSGIDSCYASILHITHNSVLSDCAVTDIHIHISGDIRSTSADQTSGK